MASRNLYPPVIESYQPAFVGDTCSVIFGLPKFASEIGTINSIHISITSQMSGESVVDRNAAASANVNTKTGVVIVSAPKLAGSYIEEFRLDNERAFRLKIDQNWLIGETHKWEVGKRYKIQLRFSTLGVPVPDGDDEITNYLSRNANNFSEWSTFTIVKATSEPVISVGAVNFKSNEQSVDNSNSASILKLNTTTFNIRGQYTNDDISESMYSYRFKLYDKGIFSGDTISSLVESEIDYGNLLEDSKTLYNVHNILDYVCKTELDDKHVYYLGIEFETINKYIGSTGFWFKPENLRLSTTPVTVATIDKVNNIGSIMNAYTSLEDEEEEGCICLKLYDPQSKVRFENFCIRRADSKDNFKTWTDIAVVVCKGIEPIKCLPVYDYTIESGVYYKYGVETIKSNGDRGSLNESYGIIKRDFEYAYLLGEGGQQLKLKFDNTMDSFNINVMDSKADTIGGKYPFITRLGSIYYKTFPIDGLISFHMDEQERFIKRREEIAPEAVFNIYNEAAAHTYAYDEAIPEDDPVEFKLTRKYNSHGDTEIQRSYDYREGNAIYDLENNFDDVYYERRFRDKVLEFLYDGKPKLFKSPTEGNVIVRLMNVSCTPNQTLGRLIYSFTSTAHEVAEATMANYLKYGFYKLNEISTDFAKVETRIGQLSVDLNIMPGREQNIIELIYNKYDSGARNQAGYSIHIQQIRNLSIEFEGKPLRVWVPGSNNTVTAMGHLMEINGTPIVNYYSASANNYGWGGSHVYVVDPDISFNYTLGSDDGGDSIVVFGDLDGKETSTHVTVDFLYDVIVSKYVEREPLSRTMRKTVGQLFKSYYPGERLYREIYNKYRMDSRNSSTKLSQLSWTCIEANPGTVFKIIDTKDSNSGDVSAFYHEINYTGILNLEDLGEILDLEYVGIRNPNDRSEIITMLPNKDGKLVSVNADVKVDYTAHILTEVYDIDYTSNGEVEDPTDNMGMSEGGAAS